MKIRTIPGLNSSDVYPYFTDNGRYFGHCGRLSGEWLQPRRPSGRWISYLYGALKLSAEIVRGNVRIVPYVSADISSISLNSYTEQGTSAQLLTYGAMKFNALAGAVGLRGSIDIPMSFGTLSPNARVEYKQTSQSAFDQSMYYTDLGAGSASTFGQPVGVRSTATGSLGLRARSTGGLGVEIEYAASIGSDSYRSQSIRGAMRVPF